MKTLKLFQVLLIPLFIISVQNSFAQSEFAPIGATWYYRHNTMSAVTNYNKLVVERDTIINGHDCRVISKLIHDCTNDTEVCYYENGIVFLFNWNSNLFDTLYNFNCNSGESWWNGMENIMVDSVDYLQLNGISLKMLYVSDQLNNLPIIEKIGSIYSFYQEDGFCDPADGGFLRCYYDDDIGYYNITDTTCDVIYSIRDNSEFMAGFTLAYDQMTKVINISTGNYIGENSQIRLFDHLGRCLVSKNVKLKKANLIQISQNLQGVIFISLFLENFNTNYQFKLLIL